MVWLEGKREESCISAGVSKDMTKYPGAEASDLIGQLLKHARLGAILYRNTALDMITYVNHNVITSVNAT